MVDRPPWYDVAMKPYGKTLADSTTCRYGCCGRKLHRRSSGHDLYANGSFKRAVRAHLRGKARMQGKRIVRANVEEL